ncbi:hypothetical protein [Paenibacillus agricola]|uniref:TspO/MBR related protein n=1 Tax=Paenibacillus agricola TaxID=2716264 RepID=A0ABX0J3F7_9BACL|nr:hypothetical protein [Paenibacillus agricola]NHN30824.1 hypothetical protein [Paenibacillus agricola]
MNNQKANFAIAGSILCILLFMFINYTTSPEYIWFIYPTFAIIHWPLSIYFLANGNVRPYSLITSILIVIFLFIENRLHYPQHPWFLYACYPILWWPILMYAGKYAKSLSIAVIGGICTILYYSILNIVLSPPYPWAIYPAYVVLWWPLAIFFTRKQDYWGFSVWASMLTILFFTSVNAFSSPDTIWAIYPIFAILWWPLSMYYFSKKAKA